MADKQAAQERLEAAHEELTAAVEGIQSGDDWARMLEVASRFHQYSANNVFLIMIQRPTATRVAGFKKWREFDRHVVKGAKGIKILAPVKYRVKDEDEEGNETSRMVVRGYTVANVFDVADTDGEPLPEVKPVELDGYGVAGLWRQVAQQITARDYEVYEEAFTDAAYGYTHHATRKVAVRNDVSRAQQTKTLIHELAHVIMHPSMEEYLRERERCEVEAESVAYLVAKLTGLNSEEYSFPYVAHWAKGEAELVTKTAERSIQTARTIIEALA